MNSKPVIFGKRGRTTIPLPLRRQLGWQAGDTIRFRLDGDRVIISREISCDKPQAQQPVAAAPDVLKLLVQLVFALTGGGGSG